MAATVVVPAASIFLVAAVGAAVVAVSPVPAITRGHVRDGARDGVVPHIDEGAVVSARPIPPAIVVVVPVAAVAVEIVVIVADVIDPRPRDNDHIGLVLEYEPGPPVRITEAQVDRDIRARARFGRRRHERCRHYETRDP